MNHFVDLLWGDYSNDFMDLTKSDLFRTWFEEHSVPMNWQFIKKENEYFVQFYFPDSTIAVKFKLVFA